MQPNFATFDAEQPVKGYVVFGKRRDSYYVDVSDNGYQYVRTIQTTNADDAKAIHKAFIDIGYANV